MATLLTQIKIKRDTYDNLKDKVLAAGEPAIAILSNPGDPEAFGHLQFAVGDGKQTFSNLSLKIKDGVTNLTGTGAENAIAVFTGQNNGNDIVGRSVTINTNSEMAGVKQISIENGADQAPLVITNKVLVNNLNAQYLNGQDHTYYFNKDNHLGYTTNAASGLFAVLQDSTSKKLYVNISSAVSNKTITLSGSDITINNKKTDSYTLNQASDKTFTIAVSKNSSGARAANSIVSAVADGTIQSHNYQLSYTASGTSNVNVGATMVYDQALQAIKFVF